MTTSARRPSTVHVILASAGFLLMATALLGYGAYTIGPAVSAASGLHDAGAVGEFTVESTSCGRYNMCSHKGRFDASDPARSLPEATLEDDLGDDVPAGSVVEAVRPTDRHSVYVASGSTAWVIPMLLLLAGVGWVAWLVICRKRTGSWREAVVVGFGRRTGSTRPGRPAGDRARRKRR